MAFFSEKEKRLARTVPKRTLVREYRKTEKALQKAAKQGASEAKMQSLMAQHHTWEYANLAYDHQQAQKNSKTEGF